MVIQTPEELKLSALTAVSQQQFSMHATATLYGSLGSSVIFCDGMRGGEAVRKRQVIPHVRQKRMRRGCPASHDFTMLSPAISESTPQPATLHCTQRLLPSGMHDDHSIMTAENKHLLISCSSPHRAAVSRGAAGWRPKKFGKKRAPWNNGQVA